MTNLSLTKWKSGTPSPGGWISLSDLHIVETMARMDFDWICFDLQHGLLSHSHLLQMMPIITATLVTPIVRVAQNDPGQIGRVLDAGAYGVIVPMIDTAADAAAAVAACRYLPLGRRSCGPMRGVLHSGPGYLAAANQDIAVIAMIETREGLANVRAIAATPGVDALFIGPMDLCLGIGIAPGAFGDPAFTQAIATIRAAASEAGCAVGIYGYTPEIAAQALADGFAFASLGTDISFFRDGAKAALGLIHDRIPSGSSAAPTY